VRLAALNLKDLRVDLGSQPESVVQRISGFHLNLRVLTLTLMSSSCVNYVESVILIAHGEFLDVTNFRSGDTSYVN